MTHTRHLLGGALALCAVLTPMLGVLHAQPKNDSPANPAPKKAVERSAPSAQNDGQRLFEIHCSRCHFAPEGFSPRISGTVVRHMRVRASLSQQEEQELLRFFNP